MRLTLLRLESMFGSDKAAESDHITEDLTDLALKLLPSLNVSEQHHHTHTQEVQRHTRTRRMRRMAATPDVAMTLALLGTRLRRVGMMASAAWSNRLPSTDERWLMKKDRF